MKNFSQFLLLFLLGVCSVNAQQEKGIKGSTSWLNNWTEFKPNKKDYGEANQILAGNITEKIRLEMQSFKIIFASNHQKTTGLLVHVMLSRCFHKTKWRL